MTRERIFILALLCGFAAFFWTLLIRTAPPPPAPVVLQPGFRSPDPPSDLASAERSARERPDDPQAWFVLATLRQAAGRTDAAREAWERTVQTASAAFQPRTSFLLGWAYEHLGDTAAARSAFESAAAGYEAGVRPDGRFPDRYQAWMRLAWCRKMLADQAGARAAWDRVKEILNRVHPTEMPMGMMYDRACCLAQLGENEAAMWSLAQAVSKGFRGREWAAADENLAPLRADPAFKAWLNSKD